MALMIWEIIIFPQMFSIGIIPGASPHLKEREERAAVCSGAAKGGYGFVFAQHMVRAGSTRVTLEKERSSIFLFLLVRV